MAEIVNTKIFDAQKKFVDFTGLDYFWAKVKSYVDDVDTTLDGRIDAVAGDVASIQAELNSLSGGAGSIATQIDNAIAKLDVEDTAVDGEYVSGVSETDGKITVTRAALPDYTDVYDAKGTAAALDAAMDARVKVLEAIDHDKLAADASAAAVATVLDGAPEKFDTLKEIAQWISDSETAESAADLVTRVTDIENTVGTAKTDTDEATGIFKIIEDNENVTSNALNDLNTRVTANTDAIAAAAADVDAKLADYYKKTETYSSSEVDDLLATNSANDQAYTDQLFASIQFASEADIDGLFA